MSERKPSVNRVLRAYSWDASLIGIEAKEPIEYPPEDKRIFAPMEDGVQQGNFSGQIFRELYERQAKGELGAEPILRERPPRDGTGDNFTLDNEKKYKIASRRVAAIKRVAARFLEAARTNRDASRRIEIRRPSGPQGSDTVKVRGKTVRVGDWIGFKSDIEQEAEVIGIRGDQITVKAPPEGFQGDYIRRYREYTLSADRAW